MLDVCMGASTPFFKAFGPLLFGRKPGSKLREIKQVESLGELFRNVATGDNVKHFRKSRIFMNMHPKTGPTKFPNANVDLFHNPFSSLLIP